MHHQRRGMRLCAMQCIDLPCATMHHPPGTTTQCLTKTGQFTNFAMPPWGFVLSMQVVAAANNPLAWARHEYIRIPVSCRRHGLLGELHHCWA